MDLSEGGRRKAEGNGNKFRMIIEEMDGRWKMEGGRISPDRLDGNSEAGMKKDTRRPGVCHPA